MVEKALIDGLVLVKEAASGDLSAEVDGLAGWTDLSTKALTYNITDSRANGNIRIRMEPTPDQRATAGAVTGTISMAFLRDSGGTVPTQRPRF